MTEEMRVRNYSERTIKNYLCSITGLSNYYLLSPALISREQVKSYAYFLVNEKHSSPSTINLLISAWKLLKVGVLGEKWKDIRIKRPRRKRLLPVILSQEEARNLVNSYTNVKHKTLVMLAYATGLRCSEMLGLKINNIDSSRGIIRVIGKGGKAREVPLSETLLFQLRKYYHECKPHEYLFEGKGNNKTYSASSLRNIIKKNVELLDINKSVSPHILRHSFATHMLERGLNLKRLQLIMGHNSLKTTSIYLHLTDPGKESVPDLLKPHNPAKNDK